MSNKNSNYPAAELSRLSGDTFTTETVSSLRELSGESSPQTVEELRERIDKYFQFCADRSFRPGVESLSLSLHVTRKTLWMWCNGQDRGSSREWRDACQMAKQGIIAYIESASVCGKLNPATSCFLLKNWGGYADSVTLETIQHNDGYEQATTALPDATAFSLIEQERNTALE